MFDKYGSDRLTEWKKFRDELEDSEEPLEAVVDLWRKAPFVNPFIDFADPASWPDPWKLIIDGKFDYFGIALGMLYTVKLTQRFLNVDCEIYKLASENSKDHQFIIVVDNSKVLNWNEKNVEDFDRNKVSETFIRIWQGSSLP